MCDHLPELSLRISDPEQLTAVWSGSENAPLWRGRLGDGQDLTIETGAQGDLLFGYGDRARFRLDPGKRTLECAPLREGLDWQRALLSKVIASVSVMLGYEALHASAVDSPEGVIAILAPSGAGKTTLALELMRRGWPLFSDDVLALSEGPDGVLAHPGTPHMNIADDDQSREDLATELGVLAGERWIAAHRIASGTRRVRLICLLGREPGQTLAARTLSPNPLSLAPFMLGLLGDLDRERSRFTLFANLIDSAEVVQITGEPDDSPEDFADLIAQTLASTAPALALEGAR